MAGSYLFVCLFLECFDGLLSVNKHHRMDAYQFVWVYKTLALIVSRCFVRSLLFNCHSLELVLRLKCNHHTKTLKYKQLRALYGEAPLKVIKQRKMFSNIPCFLFMIVVALIRRLFRLVWLAGAGWSICFYFIFSKLDMQATFKVK